MIQLCLLLSVDGLSVGPWSFSDMQANSLSFAF